MPAPPRKGETQEHFMGRCVSTHINEGKPRKQAVDICFSMWRDKHGGKEPSKSQDITLSDEAVMNALLAIEADKSFSDMEREVRIAWEEQFLRKNYMGNTIYEDAYVDKVFASFLVVRKDGKLLKYTYDRTDSDIVFGEPVEVVENYVEV